MNRSGAWSSPGWRCARKHGGEPEARQRPFDANLPDLDRRAQARGAAQRIRAVGAADATVVRNFATPELVRAVEQGEIKVSVAAGLAGASKALQRQAVADPGRAHVLAKQHRRHVREHQLAGKQLAWGRQEIYGVIYADPPWRFEPYSRETGLDRAADNHYPTMTLDEIKALDVPSIADDHCVLFLWVINRHEILLVGKKGKANPAARAGNAAAMLGTAAPAGKHSAKPAIFHQLIEEYFPNLPKIELFRRGKPRPGWHAWGLEAEL